MRLILVTLAVTLLPGCCWLSKRSCFPDCPLPRTTVVTVEKDCELPPRLKLEAFQRTEDDCPEELACYDRANAAKLAKRLADMKDWILEARMRCSSAASSQPASQPTTRPVSP